MKTQRAALLLALAATLSGWAACGGGGSVGPGPSPPPPPTLTFSGVVSLGGAGFARVRLNLSGDAIKAADTDSTGAFTFADVIGSHFFLTPTREGYSFTPSRYELGQASRTDLAFTAHAQPVDLGNVPPDFSAVDQGGQPVSLYSFRGKVVVINFSTDWCGSCRTEAAQLEELYQTYKGQGLRVLTVMVEGSAVIWATGLKVTYPVLEDTSREISAPYAPRSYPTNLILDRALTIRFRDEGFDGNQVLATIKKYL